MHQNNKHSASKYKTIIRVAVSQMHSKIDDCQSLGPYKRDKGTYQRGARAETCRLYLSKQ